MAAYNAETTLARALHGHYARAEDNLPMSGVLGLRPWRLAVGALVTLRAAGGRSKRQPPSGMLEEPAQVQ